MSLGYEVILWDWNGTLLNDAEFGRGIINDMLRARGLPTKSRDEYARLFDFPVIRFYERVGFDFEKEPFEVTSQEFIDNYYKDVKGCGLQSGSREVLAQLQARGARQLVLSASRQDHLEMQVKHYQLDEFFDDLLGIDSVHAPGKSGRGIEWIKSSGLDPTRVLLIGDTVHDAEVAAEMGIDCWLVYGGHNPEDRLRATGRPCFHDMAAVMNRFRENCLEKLEA
jgi:phosphoglycolate phosphatase